MIVSARRWETSPSVHTASESITTRVTVAFTPKQSPVPSVVRRLWRARWQARAMRRRSLAVVDPMRSLGRLTQTLGHALRERPGDGVSPAAGRKTQHHPHDLGRIILSECTIGIKDGGGAKHQGSNAQQARARLHQECLCAQSAERFESSRMFF